MESEASSFFSEVLGNVQEEEMRTIREIEIKIGICLSMPLFRRIPFRELSFSYASSLDQQKYNLKWINR